MTTVIELGPNLKEIIGFLILAIAFVLFIRS